MTTRLILLLAAALLCWASPLQGQTIKTLGFNTTNGNVVYAGTNTLRFTNSLSVAGLLLGAGNIELDNSTVSFDGSPKINVEENFLEGGNWTVYGALGFATTTNAADTRTNLGLYNTNAPAAFAALALWDEVNDEIGLRVVDDEIRVTPILIGTNAPTDTTNAVKWIRFVEGTNYYRVPLYQ